VVEVTRRGAVTRAGAPTPPGEDVTQAAPDETRGAVSTQPRGAQRQRVPPRVTSHGVDGSDAKKQSMDAVVRLELHAIPTRRSDADCLVLSTGPPPQRRGARRQYDGKVHCHDVSRCEDRGPRADAPHLPLSTAVVWHTTLQRR